MTNEHDSMDDKLKKGLERNTPKEPTTLDKILSVSPIPIFGEIAAYRCARYEQSTGTGSDPLRIAPESISGKVMYCRLLLYFGYSVTAVRLIDTINEICKR